VYAPEDAIKRWNQAKLEMVLSKNKPHNSSIINYDRHLDCNALSEHVTRPEIVSKLRSLMGDDILCWKTNIFPKYPGEAGTGWHQAEAFAVAQAGQIPVPALKYTEKTIYAMVVDREGKIVESVAGDYTEEGAARLRAAMR